MISRRSILATPTLLLCARGASAMKFVQANPLAFPAGFPPGFNQHHIGAGGISASSRRGFSGISKPGGGFVSLLTGIPGVIGGTPTSGISFIGPYSSYSASGDFTSFAGQSTGAAANTTYAAIFSTIANLGAYQTIISNTNSGTDNVFGVIDTSQFGVYVSGDVTSGITPTAGVPYFFIASILGGTNVNFLILNLLTGVIQTVSAATANTPSTSSGTYQVGNDGTTLVANSHIAAAMYAPRYMTMASMLKWAEAPWSFWYPLSSPLTSKDSIVGAVAAPPGVRRQGLLLGTGP